MMDGLVSQIELDPTSLSASDSIIVDYPIPAAVRSFGYLPDIRQLLPGDLLLFRAIKPGFVGRQIAGAQRRGGFAPRDARWTHAAVYVGDDNLCEAVPFRGVRYGNLYPYVGSHVIRVRRDPDLGEGERYRLAIEALTRLRRSYSMRRILFLAAQSLGGFWRPVPAFVTAPHLVCSQLYADAYLAVTRRIIAKAQTAVFTPAHLSATPRLSDVPVDWVSIG